MGNDIAGVAGAASGIKGRKVRRISAGGAVCLCNRAGSTIGVTGVAMIIDRVDEVTGSADDASVVATERVEGLALGAVCRCAGTGGAVGVTLQAVVSVYEVTLLGTGAAGVVPEQVGRGLTFLAVGSGSRAS